MSEGIVFDGMPPPDSINFGVGQPSADLLPVDLVRRASERFFESAVPLELNYGQRSGDERFRGALARFLSAEYRLPVAPDCLFLTAGNSQALDLLCGLLTQPGDTVFVEEASYFLAFRIFRDHGLELVEMPMDAQGLDMDALEANLAQYRPRLVYTVPSFHNPTGITMDSARRERLLRLSARFGFSVISDDPYHALWYDEPPPSPLSALADDGDVYELGSFSKILAPGLRLGWIQGSTRAIGKLHSSGVVTSGGSFNHFTSHVVRQALESGEQQAWLQQLRSAYRERRDAMQEALSKHFTGLAEWHRPAGGYFFWLRFGPGMDTHRLLAAAQEMKTGFQPGDACSATGRLGHCLRLSFAHYPPQAIHEGIRRLAGVLGSAGPQGSRATG